MAMTMTEARASIRHEICELRAKLGVNPDLGVLLKLAGYQLANLHASKSDEEQNDCAAKAAAALELFLVSEG